MGNSFFKVSVNYENSELNYVRPPVKTQIQLLNYLAYSQKRVATCFKMSKLVNFAIKLLLYFEFFLRKQHANPKQFKITFESLTFQNTSQLKTESFVMSKHNKIAKMIITKHAKNPRLLKPKSPPEQWKYFTAGQQIA